MLRRTKALALFLVCAILISMITIPVMAADFFFEEDFENYTGSIPVETDTDGNKYAAVLKTNYIQNESSGAARITGDFIASVDFMIPTGGTSKVEILGANYFQGSANGMHIYYDGTGLRVGDSQSPSTDAAYVLVSSIERDKWYNIFAVVENAYYDPAVHGDTRPGGPYFTVYLAEYASAQKTFKTTWTGIYGGAVAEAKRFIGRYATTRDRDTSEANEKGIYIDNYTVKVIENKELETLLHRARSYAVSADVGYTNGKYPKEAVDMLMDTYNEVKAKVTAGGLTPAQVTAYTTQLTDAITAFTGRKIDTASTSTDAIYVKINESGNMPSNVGVDAVSGQTITLDAQGYTKANTASTDSVVWTFEPASSGLSISGNTLTVQPGFEGTVTLKATAGTAYAKHTISFRPLPTVSATILESANGRIKVEGELSAAIDGDITVDVEGAVDIDITDTVTPDAQNKFSWQRALPSGTSSQPFTVTLTGGFSTNSVSGFYYGTGWEDEATTELNTAISLDDTDGIIDALDKYESVLGIDSATYAAYKQTYATRILAKGSITSINVLKETLAETEYVLEYSGKTSATIDEFLAGSEALLLKNGFYTGLIANLGGNDVDFYDAAAELVIDIETTTIKDICDELSSIYATLAAENAEVPSLMNLSLYYEQNFETYESKESVDSTGAPAYVKAVEDDNGNKYAIINNQSVSKDATSPAEKDFIVSVDFMIPDGGSNKAEIMGVTYASGKASGLHVYHKDGKLRLGTSSEPSAKADDVLVSNIQPNKWYNIYAIITNGTYNLGADYEGAAPDGPFFTFFMAENTSGQRAFSNTWANVINNANTEGYRYLGRRFISRDRDKKDYYIDNVTVKEIECEDLELALYSARSYAICADVGYENDKYPQGAVDELLYTYDAVREAIKGRTLTAEEVVNYTAQVETAIAKFKTKKIDTTAASNETAYVKIGAMESVGGVHSVTGYRQTLEAKGYTLSGTETNDAVVWTVEPATSGVSIVNGELVVSPGFTGEILLKATVGNSFATHKIELIPIVTVSLTKVEAIDRKITVEGQLASALSKVTVKAIGNDINLEARVATDLENKFVWESVISDDTVFQPLTVTVCGGGIEDKTFNTYYYGVGWEDAVVEQVKSASGDTLANLLKAHTGALYTDPALIDKHKATYCARTVADSNTFDDIEKVRLSIMGTEYILSQNDCTRANVEAMFAKHTTILKNNGFDTDKIALLGETLAPSFYTNAALLQVDVLNDTVADVCVKLTGIYDTLVNQNATNNQPSVSVPSGGGGGGGGGGDGFPVTLVPGTPTDTPVEGTEPSTDPTPEMPSATPFDDVKAEDWSYEAFKFLKEKNIIVGDGKSVRPKDNVTRGEFARIIVAAFEFEADGNAEAFTDADGAWWKESAEIAAANGIVFGLGDGSFGGNDVINREMLAVMVARAVEAKGVELYDQNEGVNFSDESYVSDYAKDAISFLGKKGIVSGIGGNMFAPSLPVTRQEAAQIVYNVLKQL